MPHDYVRELYQTRARKADTARADLIETLIQRSLTGDLLDSIRPVRVLWVELPDGTLRALPAQGRVVGQGADATRPLRLSRRELQHLDEAASAYRDALAALRALDARTAS